jgi:hypothetical protein
MIDRQKLESVLVRRFPGSKGDQIAAAANAIMGLEDEWEEVAWYDDVACDGSPRCVEMCALAREAEAGSEFMVLRRRCTREPEMRWSCRR